MTVGIYTRYGHHEACYAALRLAELVEQLGQEVTVFADDPKHRHVQVCPIRDKEAVWASPRKKFTDWARGCSSVIWTHVPPLEQVSWVTKADKRAILLPAWYELRSQHRRAFRAATTVLSPARAVTSLLQRRWGLRNCSTAPWDPGLPLSIKHSLAASTGLKLFVPCHLRPDWAVGNTGEAFWELLLKLVAAREDLQLSVSYVPSSPMASAIRKLEAGRLKTKRITLYKQPSRREQPLLYANHDLTIWPAIGENTGHVGLVSLAMGTPVVAFSNSLICEFLNDKNAVLVPALLSQTPLGATSPIPEYEAFAEALEYVLARRERVLALQPHVSFNMTHRRSAFHAGWAAALAD